MLVRTRICEYAVALKLLQKEVLTHHKFANFISIDPAADEWLSDLISSGNLTGHKNGFAKEI
jgi:hypothetical protein